MGENPEGFPTQRAALGEEDQLRFPMVMSSGDALSWLRFPEASRAEQVIRITPVSYLTGGMFFACILSKNRCSVLMSDVGSSERTVVCAGLVLLEIAEELGVNSNRSRNDAHNILCECAGFLGTGDRGIAIVSQEPRIQTRSFSGVIRCVSPDNSGISVGVLPSNSPDSRSAGDETDVSDQAILPTWRMA